MWIQPKNQRKRSFLIQYKTYVIFFKITYFYFCFYLTILLMDDIIIINPISLLCGISEYGRLLLSQQSRVRNVLSHEKWLHQGKALLLVVILQKQRTILPRKIRELVPHHDVNFIVMLTYDNFEKKHLFGVANRHRLGLFFVPYQILNLC